MDSSKIIWQPNPGPQAQLVECPIYEILFGGARGGGKTDGVLGKYAIKEARYGKKFNGVIFRPVMHALDDVIERARELFVPLGGSVNEGQRPEVKMPHGGKLRFRHLERVSDADKYQGMNLTDVCIEEAGTMADPAPIMRLHGVLRSASKKVPVQMILTANPGGPGHHWLKDRYIDKGGPSGNVIIEEDKLQRIFIPSKLQDNPYLGEEYVTQLRHVGSPQLVKAWLEGDWNAIEGAFFDCWSDAKHVLEPFPIPEHWMRYRSMDWGSAAPFSVGWWAVASEDYIHKGHRIPKGAIVRYREWYGAHAPNKGLKLTAEQVADGIKERERERVEFGVLDPSAFAQDGGPSIAERMFARGVHFLRADNRRVARAGAMGGWDQVRSRLVGVEDRPMLYVFDHCRAIIRTLPSLVHDPDRPEDIADNQEDHAPDELRYACMARPFINEVPKRKDTWKRPTFFDMMKRNAKTQRRRI